MDFKEYQARMDDLNYQKRELSRIFIEENKPCEIGDIVEREGNKGIVTGFEIAWQGVRPIARKIKKDGNPSQHGMYLGSLNSYKIIKQTT